MDKGDIVFWKSGVLADAVLQTRFHPFLGHHYIWQASERGSGNIEKTGVRTSDRVRLPSTRRGGRVPELYEIQHQSTPQLIRYILEQIATRGCAVISGDLRCENVGDE